MDTKLFPSDRWVNSDGIGNVVSTIQKHMYRTCFSILNTKYTSIKHKWICPKATHSVKYIKRRQHDNSL